MAFPPSVTSPFPADFTHLPYVNPDAPKGRRDQRMGALEASIPSTHMPSQGNAAALSSIYSIRKHPVRHGLMMISAASYCLLCETMEYP